MIKTSRTELANPLAERGECGSIPPIGGGPYSAVDVLWLIWYGMVLSIDLSEH